MEKITVSITVNSPVEKVWKCWTNPDDIMKWNHASDDWHTTEATNDLRPGGCFSYRMEAIDGTVGFDFSGVYTFIERNECIESTLDDGRSLNVQFKKVESGTEITETFEAENENSIELQRLGWQAILNNFGKHVSNLKD